MLVNIKLESDCLLQLLDSLGEKIDITQNSLCISFSVMVCIG